MFHKGSDCLLTVPAFGRIDDIIRLNQNLIVNAVDLRRTMVVPYQIGHPVDLFCCHAGIRQELPHQPITFHRELRDKGMVASILDDVPGLGPKRRKQLLKHFGSVKRMREASLEEIEAVPGIPKQVAEDLYAVILDFDAG